MAQDGTRRGTELARTERLQKSLPAGVSIGEWAGERKKKFFVRFGADRKVESFTIERDRNDRAEALSAIQRKEGESGLAFDPGEVKEWLAFRKDTGASIAELRQLWSQYSAVIRSTLLVKDACDQYRAQREKEGMDADSRRHTRKILERFCEPYGYFTLSSVTPENVQTWLDALKKAHSFHQTTLRHHRKDVAALFNWAMRKRLVSHNPCSAVKPPEPEATEAAVLALKDALSLFRVAMDSPVPGKLALEAFAGLRVSSAARLRPEEIDHEHKGLTLPASKHKLGKRFYVGPFPENLFTWLSLPTDWEISESYYDKLKGDVFTRAGVKNPGNVLRHSFATYHLAAHLDSAKTAALLTHKNSNMLYQRYRGKGVPQAQGLAYFRITPDLVGLPYEQFIASTQHNP